jgi:predicted dehydrogenase
VNVEQAKRVVAAIKKAGVKMQVGVQGMSDESYQTANQYIKEGYIGKVLLAQIDYSRNSKQPDYMYTKEDPELKPGDLDWSAWLGAAPKRPFDAQRYFHWRRFWDYSSGIASDLFIHRVTRIIKSCGLTFPERGVGTGGKFCWPDAIGDVPDTLNFLLDYPEGMTVQLVSSMGNATAIDHMIRGHKATIRFTAKGFNIVPERIFQDEVKPLEYEKKGSESTELHHRNLQAAIRSGAQLNCDVDLGYYGVVAAQVGSMSYRQRKYMMWDKAKERIVKA